MWQEVLRKRELRDEGLRQRRDSPRGGAKDEVATEGRGRERKWSTGKWLTRGRSSARGRGFEAHGHAQFCLRGLRRQGPEMSIAVASHPPK